MTPEQARQIMTNIYQSWISESEKTALSEAEQQAVVRQLQADYRATFAGDAGQKVLGDLIRRSRMVQYAYSADPLAVMWENGRRSMMLEILNMVVSTPEQAERLVQTGEVAEVFPKTVNEDMPNDD